MADLNNDAPRKVVLESMLIAANPLAPSDRNVQYEIVDQPNPKVTGSKGAQVSFPGIQARLVLALSGEGALRAPRQDKLYEVHYHLLNLAALSDYEEIRVYYTAYGLMRDMGWSLNGTRTKLVRDCVDYLRYTRLEYDGYLPDPLIANRYAHQTEWISILIGGAFPTEEERRGGSHNLSYVDYHPRYFAAIRNSPSVQLDIELLSQIPGTLGKAFYRTASWLRASNKDRIDLNELFERVGSNREYISPVYAQRAFGDAWRTMLDYRYLSSVPKIEKRESGAYDVIFDWGDPVQLPHRTDALFKALLDAGVNTQTAESMLREDRKRTLRIMQAYRAGALGEPQTTPAALLVGAYRTADWAFDDPVAHGPQLDLLTSRAKTSSAAAQTPKENGTREAPAPAQPPKWDQVIDWVALRNAGGTYPHFLDAVLSPVLQAAGVDDAGRVLAGKMEARVHSAFDALGWAAAIDATYAAAAYLGPAVERPAAYLATALANEAQKHTLAAAAPERPRTPTPTTSTGARLDRPSEPRTGARTTGGPTAIGESASVGKFLDIAQFRLSSLRSWVADLEQHPTRETAAAALRFVEERRTGQLDDAEVVRLLDQIEQQAKTILG